MMQFAEMSPAYRSALDQAAYFHLPDGGYLVVQGPDQESFIQRQTSQDIRLLDEQHALLSVLTSPTARILDVFCLLPDPEGIGLVTLPGRHPVTERFLKSRIFFMDKVTVSNQSAQVVQFDLSGPQAVGILRRLSEGIVPNANQVVSFPFNQGHIRAFALEAGFLPGYRLLADPQAGEELDKTLQGLGVMQLDLALQAILRVEAGLPGAEHELTEDYTPLEAGLRAAVSDNKGCYTGQEILARQVTYDKITQTLCGLRLDQPAGSGERLWADGKSAGRITSAVVSPRFGPIALAIVKRPFDHPGTQVYAGEEEQDSQPATIVDLPFSA